jgi:hypothetical protein
MLVRGDKMANNFLNLNLKSFKSFFNLQQTAQLKSRVKQLEGENLEYKIIRLIV